MYFEQNFNAKMLQNKISWRLRLKTQLGTGLLFNRYQKCLDGYLLAKSLCQYEAQTSKIVFLVFIHIIIIIMTYCLVNIVILCSM